jgi:hypothetical protein
LFYHTESFAFSVPPRGGLSSTPLSGDSSSFDVVFQATHA